MTCQNFYHRQSIRLQNYDYQQAGLYFITICSCQKEPLFGDIVNGEIKLNPFGKIVEQEWFNTPLLRSNTELDACIIMPNHFHGILNIKDSCRGASTCALTDAGSRAHIGAPLRRESNSLGSIIAGFKSAVTKKINELRQTPRMPIWQRNYYEHIIRDEESLQKMREYIFNNPAQWEMDQENPRNNVIKQMGE